MAEQLDAIAVNLDAGRAPDPVTVRELLSWFGAQRRGQNVVQMIKSELGDANLVTEPDFEGAWIDGEIIFRRPNADAQEANEERDHDGAALDEAEPVEIEREAAASMWVTRDPSYYVSKLAAANQVVMTAAPDETLAAAVTKMVLHDYSQLPVVTGERTLRGVISWKTIGTQLSLERGGEFIRDFMRPAHEVTADTSIFDVISLVTRHDYVIVRDAANRISGIVTATDLSEQFRSLSEPFLLLSEIENHLRNIIADRYELDDLRAARDPDDDRDVNTVADLTFGEYIRLLENQDRWARLNLALDRRYFCGHLDLVRQTRNDVMHFDPDGIDPTQLRGLREFAGALRFLQNGR